MENKDQEGKGGEEKAIGIRRVALLCSAFHFSFSYLIRLKVITLCALYFVSCNVNSVKFKRKDKMMPFDIISWSFQAANLFFF